MRFKHYYFGALMISLAGYAQKTWEMMAQGKKTLPIATADQDFASGGVNYQARAITSRLRLASSRA